MTRNIIYKKLVEICSEACSLDLKDENDEIKKYDMLSSDIIDMAISIELQFGLVFGDDIIFSWKTFKDVIDAIEIELRKN